MKNETQTVNTTFSEALPDAGILDSILLTVRVQNASAHYDVVKAHIWDHISKIVVKADGLRYLKDVWGQTLLAEYATQYGKLPPGYIDLMSSNYSLLTFPIMFGRKLRDGKFGLDLSRFGETRLEVTNDYVSTELAGSTSIAYDVDLVYLEDAPTPVNFIGSSQISNKTWTGNSQDHTFEVPKDYLVRRILLGCESFRSDATSGQSNKAFRNLRYLTYTHKGGGIVLRDDDLYRSDQDVLWGFPDYLETMLNVEPRTGYTLDCGITRPMVASLTPSYSADPGSDTEVTIDQRMERLLTFRRADAGFQGRLIAGGYGALDHLVIHEDDPDDTGGYLNPNTQAKVEVKVGNSSSGGSSGIIRFITQTVRPNGG